MAESIRSRYGPWALVAGASEGLGAAFARRLAAEGLDVVLVARRRAPLDHLAAEIADRHAVQCHALCLDLASAQLAEQWPQLTRELDIGFGVYNAAHSEIGPFLDQSLSSRLRAIDVNCRGPMIMLDALAPRMVARGRGGIILVSSLAAFQGSPLLATYAASKAFSLVLAEGLWAELKPHGVDVLACCAGATRTPNYLRSNPQASVPTQPPDRVVDEALRALGRRPTMVTGRLNRLSVALLSRLLPRRAAIGIMGASTKRLYGPAGRDQR